jgi:hypothetical protein
VELMLQTTAVIEALQAYVDAHGCLPSEHEIHDLLNCESAWLETRPWIEERKAAFKDERVESGHFESELALETIRKGALQMTASMLLDQIPQKAAGEQEITRGVDLINRAWELEASLTEPTGRASSPRWISWPKCRP